MVHRNLSNPKNIVVVNIGTVRDPEYTVKLRGFGPQYGSDPNEDIGSARTRDCEDLARTLASVGLPHIFHPLINQLRLVRSDLLVISYNNNIYVVGFVYRQDGCRNLSQSPLFLPMEMRLSYLTHAYKVVGDKGLGSYLVHQAGGWTAEAKKTTELKEILDNPKGGRYYDNGFDFIRFCRNAVEHYPEDTNGRNLRLVKAVKSINEKIAVKSINEKIALEP
ncbi:unnamed protein product [Linum tenue]|uniref:Uncharacterized protein n=1 Tax=Linum tenue TaxID=586396 RepID=A0AAV0KH27_9ROSI|nr:unnamed protein product [Linum tenue]